MSAATYSPIVDRGASFSRTVTWTVGESAVDLTGYTFSAQIRSGRRNDYLHIADRSEEVVEEFTFTVLDAEAGSFTFSLTAAETAALDAGLLPYDLIATLPGEGADPDTVTRLLQGNLRVSEWVTEIELES